MTEIKKKKKVHYINKDGKKEMERLINEFLEESSDGKNKTIKSDRLMTELYTKYMDKIINGVINTPSCAFYRFYEVEDLRNFARMKIYESICKRQFDPERGSVFSFFSTVVSKNLYSFTIRENHKRRHINDFVEIDRIFDDHIPKYEVDFDKNFVIEFVFDEINNFFQDKPRFQKLGEVFKIYFKNNTGKKFIKKDFIEFARTYTFSDSFCNNFFNACKKIKSVSKLLDEIVNDSSIGRRNLTVLAVRTDGVKYHVKEKKTKTKLDKEKELY